MIGMARTEANVDCIQCFHEHTHIRANISFMSRNETKESWNLTNLE